MLAGAIVGAPDPPRYRPDQMACAVFQETVRSVIRGSSGAATVADQAGRDGVLVIQLRQVAGSLELEGWYDSLGVWRQTEVGRETTDTDGFLGGRYRGTLEPSGRYLGRAVPFVPDDLAQLADLAGVLDDFLPLLPPEPLRPGHEWRDGSSTSIRRLDDGRERIGPVERYRWTDDQRGDQRIDAGDSAAVTLNQRVRDEGELRWSARYGPLGWSRRVVVNARIPATGGVRRAIRSVVEQDITVVRRFDEELVARLCPTR